MQTAFKAAMLKLSLLGQNKAKMIDCSEVIPIPVSLKTSAHLPAGQKMSNIEQAVWFNCLVYSVPLRLAPLLVRYGCIPKLDCRARYAHILIILLIYY
jgi:hypothetical protein